MATIHEYWKNDFNRLLSIDRVWNYKAEVEFESKVHLDLQGNSKFISYFLPACTNLFHVCSNLLSIVDQSLKSAEEIQISGGFGGYVDESSSTLVFTKRMFIYSEKNLTQNEIESLEQLYKQAGFYFCFRSLDYMNNRNKWEKPLAFISHDSSDKESVASVLASELTAMMCPVWYDEFSLKVGDNLRQKIEEGIKECKKCIVILSPNYLKNNGWAKKEFDSIFTRELIKNEGLILPVWHGVSKEEVFEYCPSLANTLAVNWELGHKKVAQELRRSIV